MRAAFIWLAGLSCLCSCGPAQHAGQLRDGAPLAPVEAPTAYTPAGAGLPEYWAQPQHPKAERSTSTRVLPQTPETRKEPGLWAARTPLYIGTTQLWGYDFALPPAPDPTLEIQRAHECRQVLYRAGFLAGYVTPREAMSLRLEERHCMLARLFLSCAMRGEADAGKRKGDETITLPWRNLRVAAEDAAAKECAGAERTRFGEGMEDLMRARLEEAYNEVAPK